MARSCRPVRRRVPAQERAGQTVPAAVRDGVDRSHAGGGGIGRHLRARPSDRKTGARGLRSIMEGILLDTMFDLPSLEGVEQVVISKEVFEGTPRHWMDDLDRKAPMMGAEVGIDYNAEVQK